MKKKIWLCNTKLTSWEIEPFFLLLIPEDSETDKHILVTSDHRAGAFERIYISFNENTKKWRKLVKQYTNYVWTDIEQFM